MGAGQFPCTLSILPGSTLKDVVTWTAWKVFERMGGDTSSGTGATLAVETGTTESGSQIVTFTGENYMPLGAFKATRLRGVRGPEEV